MEEITAAAEELMAYKSEAESAIGQAASLKALDEVRVLYLGKNGRIKGMEAWLPKLAGPQKGSFGKTLNEVKKFIEEGVSLRKQQLQDQATSVALQSNRVDVSLPGAAPERGARHPLTLVSEEVMAIFRGLGFSPRSGPEIETDYYNFEALNFPPDHPAREMQDTFFLSGDLLLRTHTSGVQAHTMESEKPPLRVVSCGKVYRCDFDVTHSPMFHQIEGFMVDERVTFGDLKGVLTEFLHECFGPKLPVRFRPSFFPFTEPSAEVDIGCVLCGASGCRVCKNTGWLEILGSGMIHPEVFRFAGYEPGRYSGFAFGLGIERIAMLKYGIGDIRLFYENDARFLAQFGGKGLER